MSISLDLDLVLNDLIESLDTSLYFVLITSENGVIKKSYISDEFNKSSIGLNFSQFYEIAEEITDSIGIQKPDFTLIHSDNFYIMGIKILKYIIVLLTEDQIEMGRVFQIINNCISPV